MSESDDDSYDPTEENVATAVDGFSHTFTDNPTNNCPSSPENSCSGPTSSLPEPGGNRTPVLPTPPTSSGMESDKIFLGLQLASPMGVDHHLSGMTGRVRSLCVNPKGSILCAGGDCGSVCMWDFAVPLAGHAVKPTRLLTPFPNRISGFQAVVSVHSSSDGSYFVACQDGDSPALISASGKQLGYCAMGERGIMDTVRCKGHRGPVTHSAPSQTVAQRFFTASQDGTARLWDAVSLDQSSVYAVKHGSGQLLENVVVESVAPLAGISNGSASVFATGGEDGRVQLWDARQRYRPGGAFAFLDLYSVNGVGDGAVARGVARDFSSPDGFPMERHVGGIVEPDLARPILCVRCGSIVRIIDMRSLSKTGVVVDLCPLLAGLPSATDTSPLAVCTSESFSKGLPSFLACTSRAGYKHVAGGHVVQFTYIEGEFKPSSSWRPRAAQDDVISLAVDVGQGQLFAGLQSGTVAARVKRTGADMERTVPNLQTWLGTRVARGEHAASRKRERVDALDNNWEVPF
ncbi:hypothetical protein, conserved [Trypanosoma vivax Y486]|uniref:Uncharacterized protein n=1 Tax=Trypanosoma vivax (strain Y486) TaxID=1055687 RepID=F9WR44_TRYVY|nr:hypothetical protein, conserved [Trypanosoma vivax Y486]|eukprot:CCD20028.1 hypothetical protein, conserved [Trypanosoma vivax Y486]